MKRVLVFLAPGFLFGAGLVISGMTNPEKVLNFLDFSGAFDPSLMLVMGGALAAFVTLNSVVRRRRGQPILEGEFPAAPSRRVSARMLLGAVLFGLGWGLAGVCPGPAITNLGTLNLDALVFVPAMFGGMWLAQHLGADRA